MDLVQILLLCVVGFSVLVSLLLNALDSVQDVREKNSDDVEQESSLLFDIDSIITTVEYVEESDDQEGEKGGFADDDGEKLSVSGSFERVGSEKIGELAEAESCGVSSTEKSNFRCASLDINGNNKCESSSCNTDINEEDDEDSTGDFEDWEGIERTELEKTFGKAVVFVSSKSNADRISGDVKLQLHGLQRIALEGVCYGSQPMALKVSARAKWNAWQKLGNMSRETAMEKYINILSEDIPEWKALNIRKIQVTSEDIQRSCYPNNMKFDLKFKVNMGDRLVAVISLTSTRDRLPFFLLFFLLRIRNRMLF